jgi:hypothetical protein
LVGHGLRISEPTKLRPGVIVTPDVPSIFTAEIEICADTDAERFAIASMGSLAQFSIQVSDEQGGKKLANKAWNSLWDFHLLSVSCGHPCFPLYSVSTGDSAAISAINRNLVIHSLGTQEEITSAQLGWAAKNAEKFSKLIADPRFALAMRYYGNSHYLFDLDMRIMLLWAGIEGLLDVDAEHSRRVSQYAAVMLDKSKDEKVEYAARVRKAYGLRSRVVHGSKPKRPDLEKGYTDAAEMLIRLLSKCVALGRVPTRKELDTIAETQSIS